MFWKKNPALTTRSRSSPATNVRASVTTGSLGPGKPWPNGVGRVPVVLLGTIHVERQPLRVVSRRSIREIGLRVGGVPLEFEVVHQIEAEVSSRAELLLVVERQHAIVVLPVPRHEVLESRGPT